MTVTYIKGIFFLNIRYIIWLLLILKGFFPKKKTDSLYHRAVTYIKLLMVQIFIKIGDKYLYIKKYIMHSQLT
jgi:hypothetical protein